MTFWIGEKGKVKYKGLLRKDIHFQLYQKSIKSIYGRLGFSNRLKLLWCIEGFIKELYLDKVFVGFYERGIMMEVTYNQLVLSIICITNKITLLSHL